MTTFSMSLFKTPIRHVQARQADVPTTHFVHDDGCMVETPPAPHPPTPLCMMVLLRNRASFVFLGVPWF